MTGFGGDPALVELDAALTAGDGERIDRAVAVLEKRIALVDVDVDEAITIAQVALDRLRASRRFRPMIRVAEATGREGARSPKVQRLYAQALIEEGLLGAALAVLDQLREDPGTEATEVDGLLGRAHKQRYLDNPTGRVAGQHLSRALDAYLSRYRAAPAENLWHGINAAGLLARAQRDGRSTSAQDVQALATDILRALHARSTTASTWDAAIATEAHVALGNFEEAARCLAAFTSQANADAFAYASTLRQFRRLWQLDEGDLHQRALIELLEARLLRADGGKLDMEVAGRRARQLDRDADYLEAVFGADEYKTIEWYRTGLEAARTVVRVVRPLGSTVGTGFVMSGGSLSDAWAGSLVVVTNFHLANRAGLHPGHAPDGLRVVFDDDGAEVPITEILWESPYAAVGANPPPSLDTAVLRLATEPPSAPSYQLAATIAPKIDERVYVIGYPLGQKLSFSLHDNHVVGVNDVVLHYRAPTRPGSSGSPLFDDGWRLIGLHHGGMPKLARLDDPDATYEANEGFLLSAVRALIAGRGVEAAPRR